MGTILRQRLTWARNNPQLALDNGWYQDPEFCKGFFDLCEHLAFVVSPAALELSRRAVQLAETHSAEAHGDPHLIHRSYGVLSHAYINRGDLYWAGKELAAIRDRALACCPSCRSEHLRREGDLLCEQRKIEESITVLDAALKEGGSKLDGDIRARTYFLRGISYYHHGDRRLALRDAGRAAQQLSLGGPRGFFLDTPAFLAIYVRGGDSRDDEAASRHLDALAERLRGQRGWRNVRTRMRWASGHLAARRGRIRQSRRDFEFAYRNLLREGLAREAVAVTLDLAQLLCRHGEPYGDNAKTALRLVNTCLERRPDLTAAHIEGLKTMQDVLSRRPEEAFRELVAFRRSFIAPVPGVMAERFGAG